MKSLIHRIQSGSRILYLTGLLHFMLSLCFLILLFVDQREVNFENVWLKPLRFGISIFLFTWTYAWFSSFVERKQKLINVLNHIISICMLIEISLITIQAARGVASHFNIQTSMDAIIFSMMGAFIGLNAAILGLWFLVFVFLEKEGHPYRTAIIWGMAIFLLGNLSGYLIIRYGWPAEMVNPIAKIPMTGWKASTKDLKISHAIGLHAIQAMPLTQFIILKSDSRPWLLHAIGILYSGLYFITLIYALI